MKVKSLIIAALVLLATGFSSCSAQNQKTDNLKGKDGRSSESRHAGLDGRVATDEGEAKILVAYFSWSGCYDMRA